MRSIALGLITLTLATGCGSSKPSSWSGGDTLQMKAERRAKLQGSWRDECSKVEGGTGSYDNTTTFTADGKMITQSRLFTNSDCSGKIERTDANSPCLYSAELNEDLKGTIVVECPADEFGPQMTTNASLQITDSTLTMKAISSVSVKDGKVTAATAEELAKDGESVLKKVETNESQTEQ